MTQKDTLETVSLPFGAMVLAGAFGGGLGLLGGCLPQDASLRFDAIHREWGTGGQWWVCVGQHGAHALGRPPARTLDGHLARRAFEPALGDGDHGLAAILPPPEGDDGFRTALVVSHVVSVFLDAALLARWSRSLGQNPVHESE